MKRIPLYEESFFVYHLVHGVKNFTSQSPRYPSFSKAVPIRKGFLCMRNPFLCTTLYTASKNSHRNRHAIRVLARPCQYEKDSFVWVTKLKSHKKGHGLHRVLIYKVCVKLFYNFNDIIGNIVTAAENHTFGNNKFIAFLTSFISNGGVDILFDGL